MESNIPWFRRLRPFRWILYISCWRNLHFIEVNSRNLLCWLRLINIRLLCRSREIGINLGETCLVCFEPKFESLEPISYIISRYFLSHTMLGWRHTAPTDVLHLYFLLRFRKSSIVSILCHVLPDEFLLQLSARLVFLRWLPPVRRPFLLDIL